MAALAKVLGNEVVYWTAQVEQEALQDNPQINRIIQYTTQAHTYKGILALLARALERKIK